MLNFSIVCFVYRLDLPWITAAVIAFSWLLFNEKCICRPNLSIEFHEPMLPIKVSSKICLWLLWWTIVLEQSLVTMNDFSSFWYKKVKQKFGQISIFVSLFNRCSSWTVQAVKRAQVSGHSIRILRFDDLTSKTFLSCNSPWRMIDEQPAVRPFGPSVQNMFWVIRILCVLNVCSYQSYQNN